MHCSINDILDYKGIGQLGISSIIFFIVIWIFSRRGLHLFLAILLGVIVYVAMLWLMGVKELKVAFLYICNKFLKDKN